MADFLSSPVTATVRRLDCGAVVVDYGTTWYRISADGKIIRKDASSSGVKRRPATELERRKVSKVALEGHHD